MKLRQLIGDFIRKRNPLDIEQIKIPIAGISSDFTSLRIAHVSDVHIPRTAASPREIAAAVQTQNPDLIFLTGDMMDGRSAFDGPKLSLLIGFLLEIAPVYAISGNHEQKNRKYFRIWKTMLKLRGIHFIDNNMMRFEKEGVIFLIVGMKDTSVKKLFELDLDFLREIEVAEGECLLLLHHKPHLWRAYYPIDAPIPHVIFSGHAHGGQIGIPFIKRGLIAPNQGFLPKYVSGVYGYSDGSREVISRGLASSTRPIRVNNRPHIPIVELVSSDENRAKIQDNTSKKR